MQQIVLKSEKETLVCPAMLFGLHSLMMISTLAVLDC